MCPNCCCPAVHAGASVSPAAYAASVGCRITASGASNIVEKDGYAQAGARARETPGHVFLRTH